MLLFLCRNIKSRFFLTGKLQLPCLKGWQMGIQCLLQLWEVLKTEHSAKFLMTSRINQDCVENLFSIIRAKGAQRDNPDSGQFRAAFAQVCFSLGAHHLVPGGWGGGGVWFLCEQNLL